MTKANTTVDSSKILPKAQELRNSFYKTLTEQGIDLSHISDKSIDKMFYDQINVLLSQDNMSDSINYMCEMDDIKEYEDK